MAQRKKTAPAKAAADTAAETVKEKAPRAAAKKAGATYLQAGGSEWNISDCRERAAAAYTAEGHKASSIKNLDIYIKPDEGKVYYVINGDENGSFDL